MARNPKNTVGTEIAYHLREGNYGGALEIARHEGLKDVVGKVLWAGGSNPLGRAALHRVGGESVDDLRLRTSVGTLEMDGPIGLAPGWDKVGHTLRAWQELGARHVTLGAASLFPQRGNPMPRLRTMDDKLGDHGTDISQNWYGFNNRGIDQLIYNIYKQREAGGVKIPVIAQITLNKEFYNGDLRQVLRPALIETVKRALQLVDGTRMVDGISLGLSSPNTTGMRFMQDEWLSQESSFVGETINAVAYTIKEIDSSITLIYKGDGDGGEKRLNLYASIVEAQQEKLLDAFELINTTRLPHILARYGIPEKLQGGVAGNDPAYKQLALDAIRYVYERVGGIVDIIGTGGGADQAFDMIEAGASAVGINTGVRTHGLGVMKQVETEIINIINQRYPEINSLDEIVGIKTSSKPKQLAKETPKQREDRYAHGIRTGNYSCDKSQYEK